MAFGSHFAAQMNRLLKTVCVFAWHVTIEKEQLCRVPAEMANDMRIVALRRARSVANRFFLRSGQLLAARALVSWRLFRLMWMQFELDRRRHYGCQARNRGFIVKLRGKFHEQKFWYQWLMAISPKPWQGRMNEFCKEYRAVVRRPNVVGETGSA